MYHRLYDLEMYLNNTIEGSNLKRFVESGNKINIHPHTLIIYVILINTFIKKKTFRI